MKRLLLISCMLLVGLGIQAQVIMHVQTPASVSGNYEITFATPAGGWGVPDMTDPANAILDTLMFVDDGTVEDSLGCNPLINNLTGKIAVIYRGNCEFGAKALNAQNAGAIGVVIINNVPGAPVGMAPGAVGASVTIPLVMISMDAGALLKSEILAGNVTAFIGNKLGFYANDVGFNVNDIILPPASAKPQTIAMNDTEWSAILGTWVRNFGSANQSSVTLSAEVVYNGSTIYSETSNPVALNTGDSVFIQLPDFSQSTYGTGYYNLTYSIDIAGTTDEFTDDNEFPANFYISDSLFAYAPISDSTLLPITTASYRPSSATGEYSSCIGFRDPNASRMAAVGLSVTASGGTGGELTGEFVEVRAFEWLDPFDSIGDPNLAFSNLNQVGLGDYTYLSDLQNERIFIPFSNPVNMFDDQRYIFCFTTYSADMFLGYNTTIDHGLNLAVYNEPISIVHNPSSQQWFAAGFGSEVTPSIGVRMRSTIIGVEDPEEAMDINPYPNPAKDVITIPYKKMVGDALLKMVDVSGRVVSSHPVSMDGSGQLRVDVSDISAGMYVFNLVLKNGKQHSFNVMISR